MRTSSAELGGFFLRKRTSLGLYEQAPNALRSFTHPIRICFANTKLGSTCSAFKNKRPLGVSGLLFLAAELGFEPRHTESESAVLPLHNSAKCVDIISQDKKVVNYFFEKTLNIAFTSSAKVCKGVQKNLKGFYFSKKVPK